MGRFFAAILFLFAIVGCTDDSETNLEINDVLSSNGESINRVLFGYESGEQITIKVGMTESWYMDVASDDGADYGFTISSMSGKANDYVNVTLESTESNDSQYLNVLGEMNITSSTTGEVLYTVSVEQSREPAAQTTIAYFGGTSLKSYYNSNITNVKSAIQSGALGDSGRYIYFMPSSLYAASLYEITLEAGKCVVTEIKSYSGMSSFEAGTLSTVIEDVKEHIDFSVKVDGESQRLNLVVSGHGTAWVSSSSGQLSSLGSMNYINEWEPIDPVIQTRYMGSLTDGYMDIEELEVELNTAAVKFGYILFDMCFMSSVEVLYRLKDYTDYVVASPCEVMGAGFPYDEIMPYMYSDGGKDYDLQGICESYYNYYSSNLSVPYGCVAVCVTGELEALASAQKALNLRDITTEEQATIQAYEGRVGDHVFFDLKQYVNLAADGASESELAAFNTQFDKVFPVSCRLHTDEFYTNIGTDQGSTPITYYSGVSTSAPTTSKYSDMWEFEYWALDSK